MSGGLFALLDDVAALARLAAASVDDVGAAAGRASVKAAGVVVDDTAVTPQYVHGVAAERELPIIKQDRDRLAAQQAAVHPAGGAAAQPVPAVAAHPAADARRHLPLLRGRREGLGAARRPPRATRSPSHGAGRSRRTRGRWSSGAIRTDFILSAEIMVIALNEVADEPFVSARDHPAWSSPSASRSSCTASSALIVKMDDVGLQPDPARRPSSPSGSGTAWSRAMPRLLNVISVVGIAAMLWVGGHILLVGVDDLGWHCALRRSSTTWRRTSTTPSRGIGARSAGWSTPSPPRSSASSSGRRGGRA